MKKRLLATIPVLLVVFLCSKFTVFANDNAESYQLKVFNELSSDGNVRMQAYASVLNQQRETAFSNSSGTYISYETEVLVTFILSNQNSDYDVYCNSTYAFNMSVDSKQYYGNQGGEDVYSPYKITSVTPLSDDNCFIVNFVNSDTGAYTFNLFPNPQYTSPDSGSRLVVPANSSIVCQFKFTVYGYSATGVTAGNTGQFFIPTVINIPNFRTSTWTKGTYPLYAPYYNLTEINDKIDELIEGYHQNVPQSQTVTNESSALETQSDNVHNQESSYYTQTNTALSNTGLSNFSFSQNVIGGLGKTKDQFTYVWNKLGAYKDVYIFSMTLAIALMIIRHVRPIRRKKEE